jgi:putative FmdB family regulatory protein
MPLYEYECDACGHRFEVIQRFSDPPIDKCPACGCTVHKLQSAPAFQFKGTGWYVTDYAKPGSKPDGNDGKKADGASGSEGGSTSDKPASSEAGSTSAPSSAGSAEKPSSTAAARSDTTKT